MGFVKSFAVAASRATQKYRSEETERQGGEQIWPYMFLSTRFKRFPHLPLSALVVARLGPARVKFHLQCWRFGGRLIFHAHSAFSHSTRTSVV